MEGEELELEWQNWKKKKWIKWIKKGSTNYIK